MHVQALRLKIVAPTLCGFELPVTSMVLVTILLKMGESKMLYSKIALIISLTTVLSGCADQSQQSQQAYVSPLEFKKYNCKQISKETAYISAQFEQSSSSSDLGIILNAGLMAYGMSQRYAMYNDGSEDLKAAYLRAKYDALHQASIEKNCD
ncbi:MAG: hypothetical protein ACKVOE_00015 [Rickettsiales bacterium]